MCRVDDDTAASLEVRFEQNDLLTSTGTKNLDDASESDVMVRRGHACAVRCADGSRSEMDKRTRSRKGFEFSLFRRRLRISKAAAAVCCAPQPRRPIGSGGFRLRHASLSGGQGSARAKAICRERVEKGAHGRTREGEVSRRWWWERRVGSSRRR